MVKGQNKLMKMDNRFTEQRILTILTCKYEMEEPENILFEVKNGMWKSWENDKQA